MNRLGRGQRGTSRKRAHDVPAFSARNTKRKADEVDEAEELRLEVLEPGYVVRDGKRARVVVRFGPTVTSRPDHAQVVAGPDDGAELDVLRDGASQRVTLRQILSTPLQFLKKSTRATVDSISRESVLALLERRERL